MTIGAVVFEALRALVENRCYPNTFMQKDAGLPRWPAIRYTIISATNAETVCGTDDQSTDDTRVQLDVVAATDRDLETLVAQVVTAMMDLDPPATRDGFNKTFDEETRTHRAILDYVFYPSTD